MTALIHGKQNASEFNAEGKAKYLQTAAGKITAVYA